VATEHNRLAAVVWLGGWAADFRRRRRLTTIFIVIIIQQGRRYGGTTARCGGGGEVDRAQTLPLGGGPTSDLTQPTFYEHCNHFYLRFKSTDFKLSMSVCLRRDSGQSIRTNDWALGSKPRNEGLTPNRRYFSLLQSVQTDPGAPLSFIFYGYREESGQDMKVITHFHVLATLRISGPQFQLPHTSMSCRTSLSPFKQNTGMLSQMKPRPPLLHSFHPTICSRTVWYTNQWRS